MEMLQKLKIAYDDLKEPSLQHCFLYCALLVRKFDEDTTEYHVERRRLVEYLVDVGIIAGMNTRKKEFNKAREMLDMLHVAGLLKTPGPYHVQIDGVVRSMALQIMEENQLRAMVQNGMSLKDFPDEESWTEDLVIATLEGNEIENIRCNYSPSCNKLSMLVLSENPQLGYIGDSFFEGMPGLKVLDLSHTSIESLPSSVCRLVNLTTLLLTWCRELKRIPSVQELRALKKLDLSFSGLKEVPEDVGTLSRLTYLDLFHSYVEEFKSRTLAKLFHLQFLRLSFAPQVNGEEFACLSRLETLSCKFLDVFELNKYLVLLKWYEERESRPPPDLEVQVGTNEKYKRFNITGTGHALFNDEDMDIFCFVKEYHWSTVAFYKCDLNKVNLQNYFQEIVIQKCSEARSLCSFSRIKGESKLKRISVKKCYDLEMLFSLSFRSMSVIESIAVLENLEYVELYKLEKLSVLVKNEGWIPYGRCFSHLTRFVIRECPSMKWLFPLQVMQNLNNLKKLYVVKCPVMEEIFESEPESEEYSSISMAEKNLYSLSRLCDFRLLDLPELKRVCGGRTICRVPGSCSVKVGKCPKFKREGLLIYGPW